MLTTRSFCEDTRGVSVKGRDATNCCEEVATVVLSGFCVTTGVSSGISSSRVAFLRGLVGLLDWRLVFLEDLGVGSTAGVLPLWSPSAVAVSVVSTFLTKNSDILDNLVKVSEVKQLMSEGFPKISLFEFPLETLFIKIILRNRGKSRKGDFDFLTFCKFFTRSRKITFE